MSDAQLSLILIALCVLVPEPRVIIQSALIIAFCYLTTPIAGQMIARAAIMRGVPFWKKSLSPQENHVSQKRLQSHPRKPTHKSFSLLDI